jgi:hypothetical protein
VNVRLWVTGAVFTTQSIECAHLRAPAGSAGNFETQIFTGTFAPNTVPIELSLTVTAAGESEFDPSTSSPAPASSVFSRSVLTHSGGRCPCHPRPLSSLSRYFAPSIESAML